MYQVRKKESKAKNVVIAILAIILALGAVGAVVGIGSKGFKEWDTSRWFKQEYGSRKVMGFTKLSDLEGVPYDVESDWTRVMEPCYSEDTDDQGNIVKNEYDFNVYFSVLSMGEFLKYEAGTYNITVNVNDKEYTFKDIEIAELEDSESVFFQLSHSSVEGEEIDLTEQVGKGFQIMAVHGVMFGTEEGCEGGGDTLLIFSTDKITHFEFVKIEKVK